MVLVLVIIVVVFVIIVFVVVASPIGRRRRRRCWRRLVLAFVGGYSHYGSFPYLAVSGDAHFLRNVVRYCLQKGAHNFSNFF